jgi:hypothetical protein
MNNPSEKPLNPYKTICVCYANGKKVGSVPATATNAEAYMTELARFYGSLEVKYEEDLTGGLLAALHQR